MKMKDGIYRRGAVYWVQYTARAPHRCVRPGPRAKHPCPEGCPRRGQMELRVFRESAGGTRADAKARLAEKRVATARGARVVHDARRVTFEDLAAILRAEHELKRRRRMPSLTRLTAAFAGWRAVDIDRAALERYVADRRAAGAADATIHNELAALRHAFHIARRNQRVADVPDFPMPSVDNTVECFFTVAEFDRLLDLLPESLRSLVEFAALTGLRKGNVVGLTWDDVHFDRGEIVLAGVLMKNKKPLTIPFTVDSRVHAILREQHQRRGREPTVFEPSAKLLRKAWARAVGKKGLEKWGRKFDSRVGGFVKVRPRFHDLRHTFAQHMSDAGVPEAEILNTGGWRTRSMLDRYRVQNTEARRAALSQRDTYLAEQREAAKNPRVVDLMEELERRTA